MKIWFVWKWWAWKTTLSSLVAKKLAEKYKILAVDLDSNVNLAKSIWVENISDLNYIWPQKEEIMKYSWSTKMSDWAERIYLPKENDGFYDYNHDFIEKNSAKSKNIKTISLGFIEDEKRGIESMCDYYEMSKVFLNHIKLADNEILVADLAAWVEMVSRATIMSFDLIFVISDANFKNIKVAKQIISWLEKINFKKDEFFIIPNKYLDEEDLEEIKNNFKNYQILDWIPFNEEIYNFDFEKNLENEKNENLEKVVKNIEEKIIDFKKKNPNNEKKIIERIKFLDKKKEEYLL